MHATACPEHGLVFPTPEKLDLHMNSVHYYPVGTRVSVYEEYRGRATVTGHNEHLGVKVEFDNGNHPEFFRGSELRKLKNQRPFDPEHSPEVEALRRTIRSEPKKNLSPLDPAKLPIAVSQMQSEINIMKPQRPEWPMSDFEKGRISGLETALRMLGVEIDE